MVYFVVKCIGRFSCRLSRCVVSAEQFTFNFTVSKMAARGHPPPPLLRMDPIIYSQRLRVKTDIGHRLHRYHVTIVLTFAYEDVCRTWITPLEHHRPRDVCV